MSVIALLVVAMSAGMAAAAQMDVAPDPICLVPGQYVMTTVTISGIHDLTQERTMVITVESGTATDLTFKVGGGEQVGGINYAYTPSATPHNIPVEVKVIDTAKVGTEYEIFYEDAKTGAGDKASATVYGTAIPEFATLAIPVVALLGLALFMRRKKE